MMHRVWARELEGNGVDVEYPSAGGRPPTRRSSLRRWFPGLWALGPELCCPVT